MNIAIALIALSLSTAASALDLKGFQFTDSYRYSLLDDSFSEKFYGKHVFIGSFAHAHSPFYYTDEDISNVKSDIIHYNNVLQMGYTYYASTKLALGLDAFGIQNKVLDESYTTLGDVNFRAKYRMNDDFREWALSVNPFITLPTGEKENFTTAESLSAGFRIVWERHLQAWHGLLSLGFSHSPKAEYEIVDQRNLALTQLGLSYDMNQSWNANLEAYRNFTLNADERQDEGDYFLTIKNKTTENLSAYAGAGIAGTKEVERNNYTLFVGVKLAESPAPEPIEKPVSQPVAQPRPQPKPALPKPATRSQESQYGALIELDNIFFANNSYIVTEVEHEKALKVARLFKRLGESFSHVVVEGYASTRGNPEQNLILSQNRTREVMTILKGLGIPETKISLVNYGDKLKQDPAEWKNRKVQFRVYKK